MRWIFFILLYLFLGFYALQAIKTATKASWAYYLFIALSFLVLANFIYQFTTGDEQSRVLGRAKSYAFGFLLTVIAFNLVTILFLLSEDIFRLVEGAYRKFSGDQGTFTIPQRRRFLSLLATGVAAIPFGALLYGMYKGKYNYKVLTYEMDFDDLPEAFDGYRITQLSDIHSGSFDNRKAVEYAVDLVNKQGSDAILFTGDMVNNKASEMHPWKDLFATLTAKDGVFSVLGNHDYGDYVDWENAAAKKENLSELKCLQQDMGFDLLLNESRFLKRGDDRIALVGVENWGKGGFKKAGDLNRASANVSKDDFKILMSHDPSHWEEEVLPHPYHYHLTLSGHTHGMQFGIEIPGWFKWSPVKWRYKQWAGIYEQMGHYINVNRGFGFLGYPGRVGIWPEITVITLRKKSLT